jgi:hypothetical protein
MHKQRPPLSQTPQPEISNASIAAEQHEQSKRSSNITIKGLVVPPTDSVGTNTLIDTVTDFLSEIKVDFPLVTGVRKALTQPNAPEILIVTMKDIDRSQRDTLVIAIRKILARSKTYPNLYVTNDYTPAESKAQAALRHLARQLNSELSDLERGQFMYRVRNNVVVKGPSRPEHIHN